MLPTYLPDPGWGYAYLRKKEAHRPGRLLNRFPPLANFDDDVHHPTPAKPTDLRIPPPATGRAVLPLGVDYGNCSQTPKKDSKVGQEGTQ